MWRKCCRKVYLKKKNRSSRSEMTCRVNGSMTAESFSQCWARAKCLSKQINLKCRASKNPFIYSWPGANSTQRKDRRSIRPQDGGEGYCKGCQSVNDIKAPSGVVVMKRLTGFIITSALFALPDFEGSRGLKITLQIYSLNYWAKTSPGTLHSWSATVQQAAIILQPWMLNWVPELSLNISSR